jgi:3-oxoacyl-[acyl-carrier protein] reductase
VKFGLERKRALVTGAGRGIGRSISLCLAKEGAHVAVVSRTASDINALLKDMGGTSKGHQGVAMDLMPEGTASELVADLKKAGFGPVDIIIHNLGGTLDIRDPFCSVKDWQRIWRLNMEIAIELNNLLIPDMQAKHWGRIVHISSISAMENHGPVTYCAVKAALTAYSRSMGRLLSTDGIVMTAVLPGAVFTEGGYWDISSKERPDHVKKYLSDRMAIGRFGHPDEIGNVVTFLCSEQASFCIGSVIPIDGGQGRGYFGQ